MDTVSFRKHIEKRINEIIASGHISVPKLSLSDDEIKFFIEHELTEREKHAIYLRFTEPSPTLKEIGQELGISASRVRQLTESSVRKVINAGPPSREKKPML